MPDENQGPQTPPLPAELKVFDKDVGSWTAEVEFRPGPGAAPHLSHGFAVSKLIAGGRWLVTDFKNETSGFEGHGVYGWDVMRKVYTGVWVDPMRGSLIVADGSWDEGKGTMTFVSQMEHGGRTVRWRELTELRDADTQIFRSLFPTPDGGEFEMMTVTYRRRK